ncbi:MAG: tryptophan synthase subunit alpha [Deltaproteobacteria bacterium]|nr:tryptophan synthase subunit alpha [Deltaproteobacteria bacterium]
MSQRFRDAVSNGRPLLSVYMTAGFPQLDDTVRLARTLQDAGADMLEIGMPFSDPVADGPVIQSASEVALENGMTIELLFRQLESLRSSVSIPVFLMGYWNPVMQFGPKRFVNDCMVAGVDGLILPDLPLEEYCATFQSDVERAGLAYAGMIAPSTSDSRVREIDSSVNGFLYAVSVSGVTGATGGFGEAQLSYFKRLSDLDLRNPVIVGFGIHDAPTFSGATAHSAGGIVGTAFIRHLREHGLDVSRMRNFLNSIRPAG